jgi:hypothetical protein
VALPRFESWRPVAVPVRTKGPRPDQWTPRSGGVPVAIFTVHLAVDLERSFAPSAGDPRSNRGGGTSAVV